MFANKPQHCMCLEPMPHPYLRQFDGSTAQQASPPPPLPPPLPKSHTDGGVMHNHYEAMVNTLAQQTSPPPPLPPPLPKSHIGGGFRHISLVQQASPPPPLPPSLPNSYIDGGSKHKHYEKMAIIDFLAQQASPPPPLPPPLPNSHMDGGSKYKHYEAMPMADFLAQQASPPPPLPPPLPNSHTDGESKLNFYEGMSMVDFPEGIISHGGSDKYKPKPKPCPLPTIPERRNRLGHNFCDPTGTCPPKPEPGSLPPRFGPVPSCPPPALDLESYSSDEDMDIDMDEDIPDAPMPPRHPWIEPIPPSARPKPQPMPRPDYYYAYDKRDGLSFEQYAGLSALKDGVFNPPRRPKPDPTRPRAKAPDGSPLACVNCGSPTDNSTCSDTPRLTKLGNKEPKPDPPGPPYPNPAPRPGNPHPLPPNKPGPHGPNPLVQYTDMRRFPLPGMCNGPYVCGL